MNIKRQFLSTVLLFAAGAVLIGVFNFAVHNSSLLGAGCGCIVVGCISAYQLFRRQTDSAYANNQDVVSHDERNLMLMERAQSKTFVIIAVGLAIRMIVSSLMGQELIAQVISIIFGLIFATYVVVYWIIRKNS